MKIDAHNHIGKKKGISVSVDDFIKNMDEAGIDKAVVFSFSEQIDNEYVIEFDLMGDVHEQIRLGTDQYTINLNFVNNLKDLELLGAKIEVFLNDELITMEKLVDKIKFLKEIEQEVEEDIDREAQAENSKEE